MARLEGTYLLMVDYRSSDGLCTQQIPIQYSNGETHLLGIDLDHDFWFPFGKPITNFAEMTEKQIFEEVKKAHKYYSSFNEGDNHRLKHFKLDFGQQFHSIYRPVFTDDLTIVFQTTTQNEISFIEFYKDLPINCFQEYSNQLRQLEIILSDIAEVFKVIAPYRNQYSVYGYAIRNIIILACTELDARMQSILADNGVCANGKHYEMKDFYKLKDPLKLDEYELSFYRYGELGTFTPFASWKNDEQLYWYQAYNHIKHHREKHFTEAKLFNAINAIMGYAIILIAQYGYRNELWNDTVGKIIKVNKEPKWQLEEFYIKSPDSQEAVPFPFQ
ncbi:MAG: hypothetical protein J6P66_00195 [Bacteroidaceae bacterium]|nr:hypothetical protein [Bacteroidaceae bacterium]